MAAKSKKKKDSVKIILIQIKEPSRMAIKIKLMTMMSTKIIRIEHLG